MLHLPLRNLWTLLVFLTATTALAGLAPESVLLVVNGDSTASLTVANEYSRLRDIPANNILVLKGVTNVEQLPVDDFRQQILSPVLTTLRERGLESQIRCIAYSTDLPTAIHVSSDVGAKKLPQVLTPVASINGLTFLHQLTMAKNIQYLDLNVNFYARRFGARSSDTPWQPDELKRYATAVQRLEQQARPRPPNREEQPASALFPENDPELLAAIDVLNQLTQSHPQSSELQYNLACALASTGRTDEALPVLNAAVAAGWFDHVHAQRDPDLRSLKGKDEFKSIIETMKTVKLEVLPGRGFRSDVGWQPNGEPSVRQELPRYLLSTVLGVTAGRGTTVTDVLKYLKQSRAADGTRPKGTIYYVRNGDVRSTTREWGFASAVDKLKSLGVDAVIEDGVLPQKKDQVAGAMIGIADFDWPKSESTILPGAIVEHLTSFGGVMTRGAGQTPLTEFLRHGAAGSSGTVTEPYAIQAKFPSPFIHVHYASGCSLAEAFYLSVTGPYQLLIVGDPLCNPWRREVKVSLEAPSTDSPWSGSLNLHPKVELPAGLQLADCVLYVDGKIAGTAKLNEPLKMETTLLTEGSRQITLLASSNDSVESIGRWTARITVNNANMDPRPKLAGPKDHPFEQPLEVDVSGPGTNEISILHLGRVIARVPGNQGKVTLQPRELGYGTISLQPSAILVNSNGKPILGDPVLITIQAPVN